MTRITFDRVTERHRFAVTRPDVERALALAFQAVPELRSQLRSVRFGCNTKTTQEGRISQRDLEVFEIRVNFCLEGDRSPVFGRTSVAWWRRKVVSFGGALDPERNTVLWTDATAARYTMFILFHEIAHVVYMRRHGAAEFEGYGGGDEERFCDDWAERMAAQWSAAVPGPSR